MTESRSVNRDAFIPLGNSQRYSLPTPTGGISAQWAAPNCRIRRYTSLVFTERSPGPIRASPVSSQIRAVSTRGGKYVVCQRARMLPVAHQLRLQHHKRHPHTATLSHTRQYRLESWRTCPTWPPFQSIRRETSVAWQSGFPDLYLIRLVPKPSPQ